MSILSSKPLDVTPFPSAMPPMARKITDHKNCSKSSCPHTQKKKKSIKSGERELNPPHLLEYTRSEKRDDRNDGDNPHITNPFLDGMFDNPESDSGDTYEGHPPLLPGEVIACRADILNLEATVPRR